MKKRLRELKEAEGTQIKQGVIYVRVSSKDQKEEGFSIEAQYAYLRQYAQKQNIQILKEFEDVETAKQVGRQSFGNMLEFLEGHPKCKIIVVEKTDRLYRNLKDWVTLDDLDLEIHFAKENSVYSKDLHSSQKLFHGIKVLMAKNYIENLGEEVLKGMRQKAESGIWPSMAPLGYINIVDGNENRTIGPDPTKAPLIERLFEEFSTGNHTLKEMTSKLAEYGLRTKKGKSIGKATVYHMLRNPIYMGVVSFDGIVKEGKFKAIVSRELWERVQEILEGKLRPRTRHVKNRYTYSGLVRCGHCGCAMVGDAQGKDKKYLYYHCTGNRGRCDEPYTREEKLEAEFADHLKSIEVPQILLPLMVKNLKESHGEQKEFHNKSIARLEADSKKFQKRIEDMYEDKLDEKIDDAFYNRKFGEYRGEQEKIARLIKKHMGANTNYLEAGVQVMRLASRANELFQKQTSEEKRELLRVVIQSSDWKEGKLIPQFNPLFKVLVHSNKETLIKMPPEGDSDGISQKWLPELDSNQQPCD